MISRVHHIEVGAKQPDLLVSKLTSQFGFLPFAHRTAAGLQQVVLTTGNDIFIVVTELSDDSLEAFELYSPAHFTPGTSSDELATRVNSVYNIAFEVENISEIGKRLVANRDAAPTVQSGAVADEQGCVRYVTVKSCVGDVCHTLIDKSEYSGPFLPTYTRLPLTPANSPPNYLHDMFTHIDHVAFGLNEGQSTEVLRWYDNVLNFKRMMTNSHEDKNNGYVVVAGNTGLVLRAMNAPHCKINFSIVLAEPTHIIENGATNNQKLFLDHHGGPGVHHIALNAIDIVRAITLLEEAEVEFVPKAPDTYYETVTDILSTKSITSNSVFVPSLKEHGILIDFENSGFLSNFMRKLGLPLSNGKEKFILQKFCRPFIEGSGETAFFEIIERRGGARAFGADNVTALWKALVRQLEKEKTAEKDGAKITENAKSNDASLAVSHGS